MELLPWILVLQALWTPQTFCLIGLWTIFLGFVIFLLKFHYKYNTQIHLDRNWGSNVPWYEKLHNNRLPAVVIALGATIALSGVLCTGTLSTIPEIINHIAIE